MSSPLPPPSDHFDGRVFFNPDADTDRSLLDLFRWQRSRARIAWPKRVLDPPAKPAPERVGAREMAFSFVGQSTFLIRMPGCVMLTDPIFSERASPFGFAGPKRVRQPGISFERLPRIDVVLLSHNHYDHMDLPTLRALQAHSQPVIITGLRNGAYLARKGVPGAIELDWWQSCQPHPNLRITYVPAQHWSSRTVRDRRLMLWGGFVVDGGPGRVYFAGDTGWFSGFDEIRSRCGAPDVALLPIGAYEPRWFMQSQHMNPAEAVDAHMALGARQSLAMHWGTFQLTDEGIDEPRLALERAKTAEGLEPGAFLAPIPGETVVWRGGD